MKAQGIDMDMNQMAKYYTSSSTANGNEKVSIFDFKWKPKFKDLPVELGPDYSLEMTRNTDSFG